MVPRQTDEQTNSRQGDRETETERQGDRDRQTEGQTDTS